MDFLVSLARFVAEGIASLLPVFCYVAALVFAVVATVRIYEAGQRPPRNAVAHGFGVVLLYGAAALLISLDTTLNLTSLTIGGDAVARFGGGLTPSAYEVPGATGTLRQWILATVALFAPAVRALGALAIVLGVLQLPKIGRASGNPGLQAAVRFVCGALMLNVTKIAQQFLGQ